MNGVRLGNPVTGRKSLVIPAITKGNGKQRIAAPHDILASGHRRTLRRRITIALNHTHAAGLGAGATDQQGTQDKANHQSLKACYTHTLRNDCETHPPLPLW